MCVALAGGDPGRVDRMSGEPAGARGHEIGQEAAASAARLPPLATLVLSLTFGLIPMLREAPEDAELIAYCEGVRAALATQTALGERVRVLLDTKPGKAAAKRWDWVRKGAPIIIEVGQRDMAEGQPGIALLVA